MFLVDSHCHLDLLDLTLADGSLDNFVTRAKANSVHHILNVCITLKNFPQVLKTAMAYPFVSASVGLHPNEDAEEVDLETLLALGKHHKVIAIGETGLDYFRSSGELEWQHQRFRTHIEAAKILNKPLIVHTRAAKEDTMRILQEEKAEQIGGVMHCFTEDWETAKKALDLNFYISFSGIVTFKNAEALQALAKLVPLDRMLIETDSPYLAPNPYRGKPNEPAFVRHTAEYLAELRHLSLEKFAAQTTDNFFQLFKGAVRAYV
ncbi:MAG: TatD family hydrolase [Gammaproteobacteria bacterium]|nr:TatD family hydrolase [Gammaproteobacteria bacterium]